MLCDYAEFFRKKAKIEQKEEKYNLFPSHREKETEAAMGGFG